jgi:phage shock protein PspC (stress-responsive transcriptional regulator)
MAAEKRLYRSVTDKQIAGVCAGLAKYFDLDPTIVRLIFLVIALAGGPGVILYIILVFVIPEEPMDFISKPKRDDNGDGPESV